MNVTPWLTVLQVNHGAAIKTFVLQIQRTVEMVNAPLMLIVHQMSPAALNGDTVDQIHNTVINNDFVFNLLSIQILI
jgi:hypothetical protein